MLVDANNDFRFTSSLCKVEWNRILKTAYQRVVKSREKHSLLEAVDGDKP